MAKKSAKQTKLDDAASAAIAAGYLNPGLHMTALGKDLQQAGQLMTATEARFLVDQYYISQDSRIRFAGQVRAMEASKEPNIVLNWLMGQSDILEAQLKTALDKFTDTHVIGAWIKSLYGLGPVLAAGLVAHINIEKAPTAGHIWSYAGLVDGVKWEKGQKRPWNAKLKTLCWKIGESFVKMSNKDECYYGQIFKDRRMFEWNRNLQGWQDQTVRKNGVVVGTERVDLRARALAAAVEYGPDTEAYAWTSGCYKADEIAKYLDLDTLVAASVDSEDEGDENLGKMNSLAAATVAKFKGKPGSGDPMLPPMQIHARSRRYAVKIFLSHLHEFWYETHYKTRVPKPFAIEHLGHVHRIAVPGYNSPYASNEPPAHQFRPKRA